MAYSAKRITGKCINHTLGKCSSTALKHLQNHSKLGALKCLSQFMGKQKELKSEIIEFYSNANVLLSKCRIFAQRESGSGLALSHFCTFSHFMEMLLYIFHR